MSLTKTDLQVQIKALCDEISEEFNLQLCTTEQDVVKKELEATLAWLKEQRRFVEEAAKIKNSPHVNENFWKLAKTVGYDDVTICNYPVIRDMRNLTNKVKRSLEKKPLFLGGKHAAYKDSEKKDAGKGHTEKDSQRPKRKRVVSQSDEG